MTKKPSTTKKSAAPSSRRRTVKHPPMTTFSGNFVPSNAWHVKLGIEDGRSAVAFVVIVGILVLALGATILGWAKTVSDLRGEVAMLRTEVTRLSRQANNAEQALQRATGSKAVVTSRYALKPIAHATRSGAWYFVWVDPESEDTGSDSPILRFDPGDGTVSTLAKTTQESIQSPSPTGRYIVTIKPLGDIIRVIIIDLENDVIAGDLSVPLLKTICPKGQEADMTWTSRTSLAVKLCDAESNQVIETARIDVSGN